jgi:hypothetical protein
MQKERNNSNKLNNEKVTGALLDIFISILIAIPFCLIDYRASIAVGTICIISLLLKRFI